MKGQQIGAVARLTGLTADLIRSWERRHRLISPQRDPRGARLYTDADVTRLRLARLATERGHSIGRIATLRTSAIAALTGDGAAADPDLASPAGVVTAALDALRGDDPLRLRRILLSAAMLEAPETLVLEILVPLLRATGELWSRREVAIWQEHMLSEIVNSVTGILMRTAESTGAGARALFATPPNERHAFALAFAAMLSASQGLRPFNLGASLPAADLTAAARRLDARYVIVGVTHAQSGRDEIVTYLRAVSGGLGRRAALWVGGQGCAEYVEHAGLSRARAIPTLEAFADVVQSV